MTNFIFFCFLIYFIRVFGEDLTDKIPLKEFLDAVGHLKFRGTSLLFRLPSSLCEIASKTTKQNSRLAKKRSVYYNVVVSQQNMKYLREKLKGKSNLICSTKTTIIETCLEPLPLD